MVWIKILVTLILLIGLLMQSNVTQLFETLKHISWNALVLTSLLVYVALLVNAIKWRVLLNHYRVLALFKLNLIATYYSTLLPGQIFGEVVKAYRLGQEGQHEAERIAASVVVDKITGLIGVLLVGLGGLLMASPLYASTLINMFLMLTIGLVSLLYFAQFLEIPLTYLFGNKFFMSASLKRLSIAWQSYVQQPRVLLNSVTLGIIFQLLCVGIVQLLAQSLHISLSWYDTCWVFSVVSLAVFLPLSFAGIGLREGAFVGTFHLLGISSEQALALSFSLFSFNVLIALLGGLVELQYMRNQS